MIICLYSVLGQRLSKDQTRTRLVFLINTAEATDSCFFSGKPWVFTWKLHSKTFGKGLWITMIKNLRTFILLCCEHAYQHTKWFSHFFLQPGGAGLWAAWIFSKNPHWMIFASSAGRGWNSTSQITRWWHLKYCPIPGEMIQFDLQKIFQIGWNTSLITMLSKSPNWGSPSKWPTWLIYVGY